jgi:hypothetical protein
MAVADAESDADPKAYKGLADHLETFAHIRTTFRKQQRLLVWPCPSLVGVPTMQTLEMNAKFLCEVVLFLKGSVPFYKPLEVSGLRVEIKLLYEQLMVGSEERDGPGIQVDSWGTKKLISFGFRKMQQGCETRVAWC